MKENIGFTNEEAINANPVARAVRSLMTTQAIWSGKAQDLRLKLNEMVYHRRELKGMLYSNGWPRTPHALSNSLYEITRHLEEIGIIVHREYDRYNKTDTVIITNNNYVPPETINEY